jgi:hypothetical protein
MSPKRSGLEQKHNVDHIPDPITPRTQSDSKKESNPAPPAGGGRGGNRKSAGGGGGKGGKPVSSVDASAKKETGGGAKFSAETEKVLGEVGATVSGCVEQVFMSPSTMRYMQVCDEVYTIIARTQPSAARCLPRFAFRHVCKLLFARRVEDAFFKGTGQRLPPRQRSPLPKDLVRVPMPIWDILMSIGLWSDPLHSVQYCPLPAVPDEGCTEDCSYEHILKVSSCVAFDWTESWKATKAWLDQLAIDEGGIVDGDWEEKEDASVDIEGRLKDLSEAMKDFEKNRAKANKSTGRKHTIWNGILYSVPADKTFTECEAEDFKRSDTFALSKYFTEGHGVGKSYQDCVKDLLELKAQASRWRSQPQKEYAAVTGVEEDDLHEGPYGQNLGVSPTLWRSYLKFSSTAAGCFSFSLSFPSDVEGCATWIIPVEKADGSYFGRLPRRDIPPSEWKLAVMCSLADWVNGSSTQGWTNNWLSKTTDVGAIDAVVMKWLLSFKLNSATITDEQYAT